MPHANPPAPRPAIARLQRPSLVLRAALCLFSVALLAAEDAAQPAPTAEEGALLQFINAHRVQRWEYDRILVGMLPKTHTSGVSMAGQFRGNPYPKQALAFNPKLAAAARALLRSGATMAAQGYPEGATERFGYPAKPFPAFGTKDPDPRGAKVLVLIMRKATSVESAYAESMLHVGSVNATGTPYLGLKAILLPAWQEVGIAVERGAQGLDVAMIFGMGVSARVTGGLVYADANRNLRYDPGEGLAGASVTCGGATVTTGKGGVWWASLPKADAGTVTFEADGMKAERAFPANAENAIIDWRVPTRDDLKQVDARLDAATKASAARKPEAEDWPVAMLDLYMSALLLDLDSRRSEQVNALIQPIADEFDSMRSKLLAMFDEDPKALAKELDRQRKRYPGLAARWFKELQSMAVLRKQVVAACTPDATGKAAKTPVATLAVELSKAKAASCDPVLRRQYEAWENQLATTPEASDGAPPKEPKEPKEPKPPKGK
jgi:hypothetical protein